MHPAIAQYNGFYTLDTYNNFYPLAINTNLEKLLKKNWKKAKRSVFILMNGGDVVTSLQQN